MIINIYLTFKKFIGKSRGNLNNFPLYVILSLLKLKFRLSFSLTDYAICLLFCFALALGLPAQTAANVKAAESFSAIDPHSYVDRTSTVIYDSTNGLPTNGVNDIAHTKDGFLWIGSYCGLIRYDGNHYELLDTTGGLSSIESLFVDSQDRLWIGTNDSGLALMDRGELRVWDEDHGFPSAKVGDVQESDDGTIYVATTEGLVMITPDLVAHTADDPRVANA